MNAWPLGQCKVAGKLFLLFPHPTLIPPWPGLPLFLLMSGYGLCDSKPYVSVACHFQECPLPSGLGTPLELLKIGQDFHQWISVRLQCCVCTICIQKHEVLVSLISQSLVHMRSDIRWWPLISSPSYFPILFPLIIVTLTHLVHENHSHIQ